MKSLKDTFRLNNSVEIPCLGFGTWQTPNGQVGVNAVKEAISVGYRHIDTAEGYGNEESVGRAVKESGVPRKEIFVTSKLDNSSHGYDKTLRAFEQTMKNLDMEYLDLFLVHWPNPVSIRDRWKNENAGTWKAFEELYDAGRIRSLGISNFLPHHIDALLETAKVKPAVNQIRLCPGETQPKVAEYCRAHDILLEAYSPLGTGLVFEMAEMKELSRKYAKTVAQICLRWSLQMGWLPLPKSVTPLRIRENAQIFDFELSEEDVKAIAAMQDPGQTADPDTVGF